MFLKTKFAKQLEMQLHNEEILIVFALESLRQRFYPIIKLLQLFCSPWGLLFIFFLVFLEVPTDTGAQLCGIKSPEEKCARSD